MKKVRQKIKICVETRKCTPRLLENCTEVMLSTVGINTRCSCTSICRPWQELEFEIQKKQVSIPKELERDRDCWRSRGFRAVDLRAKTERRIS